MFGKDFLQDTMDDLESHGIRHPTDYQGPLQTGTHKPGDFDMPGRKPMKPPTRMAGARLGAVGVADAIAGELANQIILPVGEKIIGAGVDHLADTLRNPGANSLTSSLLGTLGTRF